VVAEFEPEPLRLAILGLTAECRSRSRETQVAHWLGLIKGYLQDFTQPFPKDSPLQTLWLRVAARLDHEWTPETLAREAGCSPERLRRMCHRELGRSPLQQVVYLRMRKAAELLGPNQLTLREVAKAVGYENPLRFSNAFKAHVGCRPSEYRQRSVEKNA
jgi:AraC-like DNA-binding protein